MGHGPTFGEEYIKDCGFTGVNDGRYFGDRLPRPQQKTGPEHDPNYSGWVLTIDRTTLAGIYVIYEEGNATQIIITDSFGPGGNALKTVHLPEAMGILKADIITSEETGHRMATFEKGSELWGIEDINELFLSLGKRTDREVWDDIQKLEY